MIKPETVDKIRESTDIVSVIEEYFPLKRAGVNYKALCPFHQEKTPSFIVSPDKQIFHCFGCGESGNVINFIMKIDGIDFIEAVKRLAERSNIQLEYDKSAGAQKRKEIKTTLIEFNGRAANFFNKYLYSSAGESALEYLTKRGVSREMIEKFKLGFSPGSDILTGHALKEGINSDVLIKSGLAGINEKGKIYSKFRKRIMFPIFNERGEIVGFGGRVMDDSLPKYLNTPQNEVFEKRQLAYGLFQGKKEIMERRKILLLEGYMDVIAAHQFGIKYAVATLGTSLTGDHIYKLRRWVDEVIMAFDSDEAGNKATERGLEMLLNSEMLGRICILPSGSDPEDVIRDDAEDFKKRVDEAQPAIEWRIDYSLEKFKDIKDPAARKSQIIRDLTSVVESISMPIKKMEMVKMLSEKLSLPEGIINQEITRYSRGIKVNAEEKIKQVLITREQRLIREILHVVIKYPEYIKDVEEVVKADYNSKDSLFEMLSEYVLKFSDNFHSMISKYDGEKRNMLTELSLKDINAEQPRAYLRELKKEYLTLILEKRYEVIAQRIKDLINNDKPINNDIKEEFSRLTKLLKGRQKGELKINI